MRGTGGAGSLALRVDFCGNSCGCERPATHAHAPCTVPCWPLSAGPAPRQPQPLAPAEPPSAAANGRARRRGVVPGTAADWGPRPPPPASPLQSGGAGDRRSQCGACSAGRGGAEQIASLLQPPPLPAGLERPVQRPRRRPAAEEEAEAGAGPVMALDFLAGCVGGERRGEQAGPPRGGAGRGEAGPRAEAAGGRAGSALPRPGKV